MYFSILHSSNLLVIRDIPADLATHQANLQVIPRPPAAIRQLQAPEGIHRLLVLGATHQHRALEGIHQPQVLGAIPRLPVIRLPPGPVVTRHQVWLVIRPQRPLVAIRLPKGVIRQHQELGGTHLQRALRVTHKGRRRLASLEHILEVLATKRKWLHPLLCLPLQRFVRCCSSKLCSYLLCLVHFADIVFAVL